MYTFLPPKWGLHSGLLNSLEITVLIGIVYALEIKLPLNSAVKPTNHKGICNNSRRWKATNKFESNVNIDVGWETESYSKHK